MTEAPAEDVRKPAVAGTFYPAGAADLQRSVHGLLRSDPDAEDDGGLSGRGPPKAVIAPHAGYRYSGATAAHAYRELAGHRGDVARVVVVGPAHRVPFRGVGLTRARTWSTPLGDAEIDHGAMEALDGISGVAPADGAHRPEHSIEVHLPFIREVLGDVPVVPLVVGRASTGLVARCLAALWGGDDTVIVASSDLSHYLDDGSARIRDRRTASAILEGRAADIGPREACGCLPVGGLLRAATVKGLAPELLHLSTSADANGQTDRVVGYGSFALRPPGPLTGGDGDWLAGWAVAALTGGPEADADGEPGDLPAAVRRPGGSFVTLTREGGLLGCIGTLEARRPLWRDVARNARLAAFRDPRFEPLEPRDLSGVGVKVSVLSPMTEVPEADPDRLREVLRPGVDGLVVAGAGNRATFLPDVWSTLSEVDTFLSELARKAQWHANWVEGARAWRYTVQVFSSTVPG